MSKRMGFHNFCFFPVADDRTLHAMADSIASIGLIEPIVLFEGKVLDGRCRYLACEMSGVAPEYVEFDGVKYGDPLQYVISKNLHRQHLSVSQIGDLVQKEYEMVAENNKLSEE